MNPPELSDVLDVLRAVGAVGTPLALFVIARGLPVLAKALPVAAREFAAAVKPDSPGGVTVTPEEVKQIAMTAAAVAFEAGAAQLDPAQFVPKAKP